MHMPINELDIKNLRKGWVLPSLCAAQQKHASALALALALARLKR